MINLNKTIISFLIVLISFSTLANEDLPEIKYEKFTLPNGLRVIVHEDRKIPVVAVNVWYHVGSKDERPGKTGFAHLFEHLMFNGTENYNNEYFSPFQQVGATDMNGTTNNDRTNYFENVPTPALDLALWMESDRMGHLLGVVNEEKLSEQRGVVQNEKRQGENQPYGRVFLQASKSTFPVGHPYSWTTIGSLEDLSAATLEDVQNWFKTYYGPNNAVLSLAGDINADEAKEIVTKYFGDIPPGPSPIKKKKWIAKRSGEKREIMFDRVPNTRIYKVWNTPEIGSPEHSHFELMASLLTGGKNSSLYQELVYKRRLATSVSAFYYDRELAGQFWIAVDLANGQSLAELEAALDDTLSEFIKRGPNAKRLKNTKTSIRASWIKGLQRIGGFGGKSDLLAYSEVYSGDPGAYLKFINDMMEITNKDIKTTASTWLTDGAYVLTVVPEETRTFSTESVVDRTQLPFPTDFPVLDLPKIQRAKLSNGLDVVFAERHDVPMINLSFQIKSGHATDPKEQPGLASFTMSMLTEGTGSYDALELSNRLEELGTDLYTNTGLDVSSVNISSLKSNFVDSLKIMHEVITDSTFDQTEIERKKSRWLAAIDQSLSTPNGMVSNLIPEILYGENHPYAKPFSGNGTRESIQWMNREDLINYKQRFIAPSNASLIVVGDTTLDEVVPMLESQFGKLTENKMLKGAQLDYKVTNQPETRKVYLIDKPGAVQSLIVAGQLMPAIGSSDEIDIDLMNRVIGGSFTSRLNMNLREDKSWSYGVRTRLSQYKGPRPMLVYAPVQTDKTIPSIQEIIREYDEYLSSNPAKDEELEAIVKDLSLGLIGDYETFGALMSGLSGIVSQGRDDNYIDTLPTKYRSITIEDINSAAIRYLDPSIWTWVIVGDLSKIEEGIEELNLGKIEVITLD
ncbi:MAG TPA: insulinase family protein [Gammaproteobacteria bacterium]|jgi:zinc protease|nr:insulinase family protein [Gammaproteobacteria bacterium]